MIGPHQTTEALEHIEAALDVLDGRAPAMEQLLREMRDHLASFSRREFEATQYWMNKFSAECRQQLASMSR